MIIFPTHYTSISTGKKRHLIVKETQEVTVVIWSISWIFQGFWDSGMERMGMGSLARMESACMCICILGVNLGYKTECGLNTASSS